MRLSVAPTAPHTRQCALSEPDGEYFHNLKALERAFGAQESGPTLARISVLYGIGHDLVVDARVAAICVGEHELALEHLAAAEPERPAAL